MVLRPRRSQRCLGPRSTSSARSPRMRTASSSARESSKWTSQPRSCASSASTWRYTTESARLSYGTRRGRRCPRGSRRARERHRDERLGQSGRQLVERRRGCPAHRARTSATSALRRCRQEVPRADGRGADRPHDGSVPPAHRVRSTRVSDGLRPCGPLRPSRQAQPK